MSWLRRTRRRIRRLISRSEWVRIALGIRRVEPGPHRRGLILVQIDGLARPHFERAMAEGRMPFLRRLHDIYGYKLHSFYSGLPSSTPAVQGELFYGHRTAVPAFSFVDKAGKRSFSMMDHEAAAAIEAEIRDSGEALLEGGSCYSNIYTGGAVEAHFCASQLGWDDIFGEPNILRKLVAGTLHFSTMLRVFGLAVIELGLGIIDMIRGVFSHHSLAQELKFVPVRVAICILLREWITMGAQVDTTRGMPIIQLNYLGYDEQSHRRGPHSAFAFWTLRGIDDAIERLWRVSQFAERRDYELWVYSDHGQESTLPYELHAGRPLHEVVAAIVKRHGYGAVSPAYQTPSVEGERAAWMAQIAKWSNHVEEEPMDEKVLVRSKGPVGHIYFPWEMSAEVREDAAAALVAEGKVPMVLWKEAGEVFGLSERGRFRVPAEAGNLLGHDHPFLAEAAEDLAQIVRHQYAGDLVLSGWRLSGAPISFPIENGSHAGPGNMETHGFVLTPHHAPVSTGGKAYLRPTDLRAAVLRFRRGEAASKNEAQPKAS